MSSEKVGILGAGIAGLYTALILDSLDIEFEVLEASDRAGGRMFSYKFPGGNKYDYYDAGAMRFPLPEKDKEGRYKDGVTRRLAELIEYEPLNKGHNPLRGCVIPYHFQARKGSKPGARYFNGTCVPPFGAQAMGVGDDYIRAGVGAISNDVTEPFVQMLLEDIKTGGKKGWERLMANDSYTVRSYMATKYMPSSHLGLPSQHLPNSVINWCELFGPGIDEALSEAVLTSMWLSLTTMDDTNIAALEWKCFQGGSETLPRRIEEYLNKKGDFIRFNARVTAISQNEFDSIVIGKDDTPGIASTRKAGSQSVAVTVNNNEARNYSHVISTIPLPVLRTINLRGADLDIMQNKAVNEAHCYPVVKIAILFKSDWWTTKLGIVGGQSLTDLPVRMIIYPSHGIDSSTPSKVLIATYNWGGDALRFGILASLPEHRDTLKECVLRDLAKVHSGLHPDVTYEYLQEQFVDIHVKDWAQDQYAMGAFSVFKPCYFRDLYPSLTRPAAGKRLHFAGEAVSSHHASVVGALISSWRAVKEYLEIMNQDEKMKEFCKLWGESPECYRKFLDQGEVQM